MSTNGCSVQQASDLVCSLFPDGRTRSSMLLVDMRVSDPWLLKECGKCGNNWKPPFYKISNVKDMTEGALDSHDFKVHEQPAKKLPETC